MLRTIASIIGTIILIIVALFVIQWGLAAYRVSTTDNTVATVCDTSRDHVFTSEGVLNADGRGNTLQPGQVYSFYTQKRFPWEFPTIISARPVGTPGPGNGLCGSDPGPPPMVPPIPN